MSFSSKIVKKLGMRPAALKRIDEICERNRCTNTSCRDGLPRCAPCAVRWLRAELQDAEGRLERLRRELSEVYQDD